MACAARLAGGALALVLAHPAGAQTPVRDPVPRAVTGIALTRDGAVAGWAGGTAVMLRGDSVDWVGTRVGGDATEVYAASAAGAITGMVTENYVRHGYVVLAGGAVHRLPGEFFPAGVNDAGQVAGVVNGPQGPRGAIWQAGKPLQVIEPDPGEQAFIPIGINNPGELVGTLEDRSLAAVWARGNVRELSFEAAPERLDIHRRGVTMNDLGQVIGRRHGRPVLWTGAEVVELPLPEGASWGHARAINNRGQVVGSAAVPEGVAEGVSVNVAVLWQDGTVRVLRAPDGAFDCSAHAVNDAGAVLGACRMNAPWAPGDEGAATFELSLLWENGVARPLCTAMGPGSPDFMPGACDPASYAGAAAPAEVTLAIHPSLPPYRVLFETHHRLPVVARVFRGGDAEPVQEIRLSYATSAGQPVQLVDLNFDGYQDLQITRTGEAERWVAYHLFDPASGRFVHWPNERMVVPDPEKRVLVETSSGPCSGSERIHRWYGDGFRVVRWREWKDEEEGTVRVTRELRGGAWVVVSRAPVVRP
jgi:hypothetical protein